MEFFFILLADMDPDFFFLLAGTVRFREVVLPRGTVKLYGFFFIFLGGGEVVWNFFYFPGGGP